MKAANLGDRLQLLRKQMNFTQKSFAEFLEIPQPSISAYENGRNSPTTEVLINIAQKCNVSLDWLCGLSATPNKITSLTDLADVFFSILEINEIHPEIELNEPDIESADNRWYARLTFYGRDFEHSHNSSVCNLLRTIRNHYQDFSSYGISKETYEIQKEKTKEYYSSPLTKIEFPDISHEERVKKYREYIDSIEK